MVETKPPPPVFANESLAGPLSSFVLEPATGNELGANAEALQKALAQGHQEPEKPHKDAHTPPHCVWIAASRKSIRAAVNVNGERFAKVELQEEEFAEVFYITRHGELPKRLLYAFTR